MTDQTALALKIGDLLIRSNVLTIEALQDAVSLCAKMHMPLGRVVEMQGTTTSYAIESALHLQSQLENGNLKLDHAVRALELVAKQNIELETALRIVSAGEPRVKKRESNMLGSALLAAGLISKKEMEDGIDNALNTGLPLGIVLINTNSLNPDLLQTALSVLALIKKRKLHHDEGIQVMRAARLRGISLKRSLEEHALSSKIVEELFGIAELFKMAGFISYIQLLSALELELLQDKSIDEILLECGYTNRVCITAANLLLAMIVDGSLGIDQAALIMKRLKGATTPEEMTAVLSNLDENQLITESNLELAELLQLSGFVSARELSIATPISLNARTPLIKTLLDAQIITPSLVSTALECKDHIDAGNIVVEQGIIALVFAHENDIRFSGALKQFGWFN